VSVLAAVFGHPALVLTYTHGGATANKGERVLVAKEMRERGNGWNGGLRQPDRKRGDSDTGVKKTIANRKSAQYQIAARHAGVEPGNRLQDGRP